MVHWQSTAQPHTHTLVSLACMKEMHGSTIPARAEKLVERIDGIFVQAIGIASKWPVCDCV